MNNNENNKNNNMGGLSFENSGLPKNKNIEKAYNHAVSAHVERFNYEINLAHKSVDTKIKQHLEVMQQTSNYNDEQMKKLTAEQEKIAQSYKEQITKQLTISRNVDFKIRILEPACILSNSVKNHDHIINAALLLEGTKSSKDYKIIKEKFGEETSDIISSILDMEAHPSEQDTKIKLLSNDAKRVNLALIVGNLKSFIDIGKQLPPEQKIVLTTGREGAAKKAEFASEVRGLDKKLDDMFVETFNEASKYLDTGFMVFVDDTTNRLKFVPNGNGKKPKASNNPSL